MSALRVLDDVVEIADDIQELPPDADLPVANVRLATVLIEASIGVLAWRRPDLDAPVAGWRLILVAILTALARRLVGVR